MKQEMTQQILLYSSSCHCFAYICVLQLLLYLCEEHINYQYRFWKHKSIHTFKILHTYHAFNSCLTGNISYVMCTALYQILHTCHKYLLIITMKTKLKESLHMINMLLFYTVKK
jgi:hypothetical protein